MKKANIRAFMKIALPITASLGLFIFIIFGVHMPEIKKRLIEQKKEHIHDLTESAISIITHHYTLYARGDVSEEEAKKQTAAMIEDIRFGPENKDYFWITDYHPNMVMHPYRNDLNGMDLSDFKDPSGKRLFIEMVDKTKKSGEAYVEYQWQWKDDSTKIVPKLSYVARFKPWQWIIGTGVYINDIDEEVNAQVKKLLVYTLSVFIFIIMLSAYVIYAGIKTNRELSKSEDELKSLNEGLEAKVQERTKDLQKSLSDLKDAQKQLIESEKMVSLGSLVAGVAHEINTPIGIGLTSSTFLEEKLKELNSAYAGGQMKKSDLEKFIETGLESLKNITSNLLRAANLIKSFKQVAVDQSSEMPRRFGIKQYIEDILMSLKPRLKTTSHEVIINAPDDLYINSYPGAYMQIVSNLILNSLIHGFENMEKGTIKIEVKPDGNNLSIIYTDNGIGMTQEQLSKIYDPFYTTKRNSGGSGLGMNIVYNLVTRKLGGSIFVSSKLNEGTVFIITVPMENINEPQ